MLKKVCRDDQKLVGDVVLEGQLETMFTEEGGFVEWYVVRAMYHGGRKSVRQAAHELARAMHYKGACCYEYAIIAAEEWNKRGENFYVKMEPEEWRALKIIRHYRRDGESDCHRPNIAAYSGG